MSPRAEPRVAGTLVNVSCDKIPEPIDTITPADPRGGLSDTVVTPTGLMWNPAKWPIGMRCGMELPSEGDGLRRIITGLPPMQVEDPPGSPPRTEADNQVNQEALQLLARAVIELARQRSDDQATTSKRDAQVVTETLESARYASPPRPKRTYCPGSDAPPVGGSIKGQKMGVCPVCEQRLNIRYDGNLRKHRTKR